MAGAGAAAAGGRAAGGRAADGARSVAGWLKQASLDVRAAGGRGGGGGAAAGGGGEAAGGADDDDDDVLLLHYNDVYNVEQTTNEEPVGGALRFSSAMRAMRAQHPHALVLFSGDAFSPSMLSTFTKGEQMVPVLNAVGTDCAVFGNHDFDFGLEVLSGLAAKCAFPWLMSNVVDRETGRPLGDGRVSHAATAGARRRRLGFIGLVEEEWLETLATVNLDEVTYIDYVEAGARLAAQLKAEGCEAVVALTHMRWHNDARLAAAVPAIDLVLGGHDHFYRVEQVGGTTIVKSGTDFRQFSSVRLRWGAGDAGTDGADARPRVAVTAHDVTSAVPEDLQLKAQLDQYTAAVEGSMGRVVGRLGAPLDGRFSALRTGETNLGSWACDVVRAATHADIVILNSGTFRSDRVHPAGAFTLRDLCAVVPMRDPLVLLAAPGAAVLAALENGVSLFPRLEGRFPQVSGLSFAFDPRLAAGRRVAADTVRVGDEPLRRDAVYRLAVKHYMYLGHDGYTALSDCPVLVDEDSCPELGVCLQNHFDAVAARLARRPSAHRLPLVAPERRHSVAPAEGEAGAGAHPLRRSASLTPSHAPPPALHRQLVRRASLEAAEAAACALAPSTAGRVRRLDLPQDVSALAVERAREGRSPAPISELDETP